MSKIQDALKQAEEQRATRAQSASAGPASATLSDEVQRLEASLAAWRARPADSQWDEEARRCQTALASCEERLVHAQQQRASLQAQAAEQERVVAQAATYLAVLQRRLRDAEAGIQEVERERTVQGERLSAFRQCQTLAQAAAEAEQHLQTKTEAIARIARVQQRITEKLSQHQRVSQELRDTAATLRRQLAETLARAQMTNGPHTPGDGRHE